MSLYSKPKGAAASLRASVLGEQVGLGSPSPSGGSLFYARSIASTGIKRAAAWEEHFALGHSSTPVK